MNRAHVLGSLVGVLVVFAVMGRGATRAMV